MANFEYIDEVESGAEVEEPVAIEENKATTNNSERASFWEDLLRDRYEVHKVEEINSMGKRKRRRKQVLYEYSIFFLFDINYFALVEMSVMSWG